LPAGCPACGFSNQPEARFCGGCGRRLGDDPATPAAATVAPGERRQVTVLFADLAGFTALSAAMDAEDLHALMTRFFDAVDEIVVRFGGSVDKHIGDAVMALFGAPIAHGDDPERAARAASEIHRRVAELGAALERRLAVHIGIAAGEVVAGDLGGEGAYTVLGDSVNLAARLVEQAGPGQTLLSDSVRDAIAARFDCAALGELPIKGVARAVPVWRLVGPRSVCEPARRSPFVGRQAELRQLQSLLDVCRREGDGHAVLLRGEAGIGKTRLLEEVMALARREGFALHRGLVLDFGVGSGQDAIAALVRSLLGLPMGGDPGGAAEAIETTIRGGVVRPDQRAFLLALLGLPLPRELRSLYEAMDSETRGQRMRRLVADVVCGTARDKPCLLVVEDIHWADEQTLYFLAEIAAASVRCRAVLIMTSRIDGDPLDRAWRSRTRGSGLSTIDLGPLQREHALQLASATGQVTEQILRTCVERAEGNPLFLEQLLRNAAESGDTAVPASIHSLVLARMDRLPPPDRRAIQAASVIGQMFGLDLLRQLLDDQSYECGVLIDHQLVRPEAEGFLFGHALIREGIYSSLLKGRRRELHLRAADWFSGRDLGLRAEHLECAGSPEAAAAYLAAAQDQSGNYRSEQALRLCDRGLAIAADRADRFALTCLRALVLHDLGNIPESLATARAALDLAGDERDRCLALIRLAAAARVSNDFEAALSALEQAQPLAERHNLADQLAEIHHTRGNIYFPLGRIDGCLVEHQSSLRYARRANSAELEAKALGGVGDGEYARGRMVSAHRRFNECVALSRKHGLGRIEVAHLPMAGLTRSYVGDLRGSYHDIRAAIEAARSVGHHRAELNAHSCLFNALVDLDEWQHAEAFVARAEELIELLGARAWRNVFLHNAAEVIILSGDLTAALAREREALQAARETTLGFFGPRILAKIALLTDDPAERDASLREGESILEAGAVGHNHLWFRRDAIETGLEHGEWDLAARHADVLAAFTAEEPLPWSDFVIRRGRALVALGRGDNRPGLSRELRHLRREGEELGFLPLLPALDRAIARQAGAAVTGP
jgi:class 3 adenylate cyclase/tetratricopeptide (TPR) repeat protein